MSIPRYFSKGYAHANTDGPPKVPMTEVWKQAKAWARKHPSPFRRRTRAERTKHENHQ